MDHTFVCLLPSQGCANIPPKGSLWQDIPLPWQPEMKTNGAALACSILSGLGFQSLAAAFQDLVSETVARNGVAGGVAVGGTAGSQVINNLALPVTTKSAESPETTDDVTRAQVESNCQHELFP